MVSIWEKTVTIPNREMLQGDYNTDVLVIGAGLAGILTAYKLQKHGRRVIVVDSGRIFGGQSKNTTAKITSQHGLIYEKLAKQYGYKTAALYAKANEGAIAGYADIIKSEDIKCHFENVPVYLYSRYTDVILKKERCIAEKLGIKSSFVTETELPFEVKGAVRFDEQAQFNPMEFVKNIASSLEIYENTEVKKVRGKCAFTNAGTIYAKKIVFASHFPFPVVPGFYFARQHQERSYVAAVKGVKNVNGMYYGIDKNSLSFRDYEDMVIISGEGRRTGENMCIKNADALKKKINRIFPGCEYTAVWSAQDVITHDGLPFIGRFSIFEPDWYVITGAAKWGMTTMYTASDLICDMICGKENQYSKLYTPMRFHLSAAYKNMFKDYAISTKEYISGLCGEKKRCTHMGCALHYNKSERVWECRCHGSRYDKDGIVIDNPATDDFS
ncbi:MAG: FAD-dependent oxidoreductase [Lachnospiraceae bacterium]|nr:FAD-dependent oxidoreductase [Lachnospiraceae bacterium]